jgi:hypothetical protein
MRAGRCAGLIKRSLCTMNKVFMLALGLTLVGCGGDQDEVMMEEQVPAAEETAPVVEPVPAEIEADTGVIVVDTTTAAPADGATEEPGPQG